MRKRKAMLSVALGTVCLASSATAASNLQLNQQLPTRLDSKLMLKSTADTTQTPVWPDDAKVRCSGINPCKGQGSCAGATNSCAGKNPCKGFGLTETTAAICRDKGGKIVSSSSSTTIDGKGK